MGTKLQQRNYDRKTPQYNEMSTPFLVEMLMYVCHNHVSVLLCVSPTSLVYTYEY